MNPGGSRRAWIAGIGPWAGVGTSPAGIMVGGGLAASLTGTSLAVAAVSGLLLLSLLAIANGEVGRRAGRTAIALLTGPLGGAGSRLAGAALALMMVGWLGVNAGVAGDALGRLAGIPAMAGTTLFLMVMTAVAWRGLRALSWFAVTAGAATVLVASRGMWLARDAQPAADPVAGADVGILGAAALVVGFGAAFALRAPDFIQTAKDARQVSGNALLGLGLPLAAFLACGVVLQRGSGEWNLADVLVSLGSGEVAYLLLAIGFSGSVLTNLYSGALALGTLGAGGYHRTLLVMALSGGGLAASGIADRLLGFLAVIAIGAVTLLVLSIGHWLLRLPTTAGLNRRGLVAWCVGTSLGLGLTIAASDVALPAAAAAALVIHLVPVGRIRRALACPPDRPEAADRDGPRAGTPRRTLPVMRRTMIRYAIVTSPLPDPGRTPGAKWPTHLSPRAADRPSLERAPALPWAVVLTDYHLHLQPDGVPEREAGRAAWDACGGYLSREWIKRYADRARSRAVAEIAITEHVHRFAQAADWLDNPWWRAEATEDVDEYCEAVVAAGRDLPVILGIEMDWLAGRERDIAEFLAGRPFDLVLGSVHWFDGAAAVDHPEYLAFDTRGSEQVWSDYLDALIAAAGSGLFDVLAHIDLPKKFGHAFPESLAGRLDEAVAAIAASGAAVECSSAGLRKHVGEVYPDPDLLAALCREGVPATLSSDAHDPEGVGADFPTAVAVLKGAGYTTITRYRGRVPEQVGI